MGGDRGGAGNMNNKKRKEYSCRRHKIYLTDKSVFVAKLYLWQKRYENDYDFYCTDTSTMSL